MQGDGHKTVSHKNRQAIYEPYKFKSGSKSLSLVFRDKNLSDIISFNYNSWDQRAAADDLMSHFRKIAESVDPGADKPLVTIAMDGENAWEFFADNGRTFFETLYEHLDDDDELEAVTISEHLGLPHKRKTLDTVFPASWINHNFKIWIGEEQDNVSWDYLYEVRKDLMKYTGQMEKKGEGKSEALRKAWREFYIAEGSDWNWWYSGKAHMGTDNPFDKLYRTHLKNVYKYLKKDAPDFLKISIA
jgi:alpha-amylase/alpha-mannosidase (GH57 family)